MDSRKWLPELPLFRAPPCTYCGGVGATQDHTPPRAFLPRKLPMDFNSMTVPACVSCNASYAKIEERAAAIVTTVSFTDADRLATAKGGWLHSARKRDRSLAQFIDDRIDTDGYFWLDEEARRSLAAVLTKTAVGLLFHEFGRIVPLKKMEVIAMEHARNVLPEALLETHRRTDSGFAEVTPSGRELERQVQALMGLRPRHSVPWKSYVPGYFEYSFIRRSDLKMLCGMKLHDALTVLVQCPWPSRAGPRRRGRPSLR